MTLRLKGGQREIDGAGYDIRYRLPDRAEIYTRPTGHFDIVDAEHPDIARN